MAEEWGNPDALATGLLGVPATRSRARLVTRLARWHVHWLTCFDARTLVGMATLAEPLAIVLDPDLPGPGADLTALVTALRQACDCPVLLVDEEGDLDARRYGADGVVNPDRPADVTPGPVAGPPGVTAPSGVGPAEFATAGTGPARTATPVGSGGAGGSTRWAGPLRAGGLAGESGPDDGLAGGSHPSDGLAGGQPQLHWSSLRLDRRSRSAYQHGRLLRVSELQFRLLWTLCQAHGEVVGFAELARAVYGDRGGADRGRIQAHVRRVRRLIEPDPLHPTLLLTVWGRGFRMVDA